MEYFKLWELYAQFKQLYRQRCIILMHFRPANHFAEPSKAEIAFSNGFRDFLSLCSIAGKSAH